MEKYKNIFVDSNEKMIAVLGGNYFETFIKTGDMTNGICLVSNKRVYFKGESLLKSGMFYRLSKEERTVDLNDITGSGFTIAKNKSIHMMVAVIAMWIAFFTFIWAGSGFSLNNFGWTLLLGYGPGVLGYWIFQKYGNFPVFEISYAGGKIALRASNYSKEETQEFQKELRRAKDNYVAQGEQKKIIVERSVYNIADELKKYKELLDLGVITQDEFTQLKNKIMEEKDVAN